jgi:hypothetical protein
MAGSAVGRQGARHRGEKALAVLAAFILAGGAWFGAAWLIFALQSLRCPADSFYSDAPAAQHVFVFVPLALPAIFLFSLVIADGVAMLRRRGMLRSGGAQRRPPRAVRRRLRLLALLCLLALPTSVGFALCQFCLTPSSVLFQPSPWSGFHAYAWSEVASVRTSCWHGRSGWNAGYVLVMRDGVSFDIMGSQFAAARILPTIAQALQGQGVAFDPSRVSRDCDAAGVELLRRPP